MSKLTRFKQDDSVGAVDKENGIISGVAIITSNREALGHEMFIDDTTVDQVVSKGQESDKGVGLKARFDHPNACFSSMGTQLGRFKNFRRDGDKARADLHLLDANTEHREFILNLAAEDPDMFATSIVFKQGEPETFSFEDFPDKDENDPFFFPHARVDSLIGCDVVDEGAANDSLFGRPDYLAEQAEKWASEHSDILEPILFKIFEKYNKQNMEDNKEVIEDPKTGFDKVIEKLTSLKAKYLGTEEIVDDSEDAPADLPEANIDELNEQFEAVKTELEEAKISTTDLSEANADLLAENTDIKAALKELSEEVAELSKIKLGTPVTPEGNTQEDSITEPTKEEKVDNARDNINSWRKEETDRLGYTENK